MSSEFFVEALAYQQAAIEEMERRAFIREPFGNPIDALKPLVIGGELAVFALLANWNHCYPATANAKHEFAAYRASHR